MLEVVQGQDWEMVDVQLVVNVMVQVVETLWQQEAMTLKRLC